MKFSAAICWVLFGSVLCSLCEGFSPSHSGLNTQEVKFGVSKSFGVAFAPPTAHYSPRLASTRRHLAADDEDDDDESTDDEEEPLSKGIDSVSWLPTVSGAKGSDKEISSVKEGVEILPLFPLGGIVYTPNSEHVLNIFEPRYRQMYSDILMNGSKRFVVSMSHPTEKGRFAETGVLFELEDLKEVSEQTLDQIKYICNHKVTGRVKMHKVINPEAWESRDTYLRVEGTIIDDTGKGDPAATNDVYGAIAAKAGSAPKEEKALKDSFSALVEAQHELQEDVRFTRASVDTLAVNPGAGEDGLWQTIRLWQNYADQRLMARQNELQADFQEKLQQFLKKEKGLKDEELPRYVCAVVMHQAPFVVAKAAAPSLALALQCDWISGPIARIAERSAGASETYSSGAATIDA
jgi:Lon protease-like protein